MYIDIYIKEEEAQDGYIDFKYVQSSKQTRTDSDTRT